MSSYEFMTANTPDINYIAPWLNPRVADIRFPLLHDYYFSPGNVPVCCPSTNTTRDLNSAYSGLPENVP